MSTINLVSHNGIRAVGVIDFNTTGGAAESVTIGGVTYLEADTEDFPNGVWTNGASAANSATSLAAAINGDTRATKPPVSAVVSDVGDSVVVAADRAGAAGNLAMTSSSGEATVDAAMHDGADPGRKRVAVVNYAVTAQDILADEINIPLPFVPTGFVVNVRGATGLIDAATVLASIETGPDRILLNFAGATDPVATDIVHLVAFE